MINLFKDIFYFVGLFLSFYFLSLPARSCLLENFLPKWTIANLHEMHTDFRDYWGYDLRVLENGKQMVVLVGEVHVKGEDELLIGREVYSGFKHRIFEGRPEFERVAFENFPGGKRYLQSVSVPYEKRYKFSGVSFIKTEESITFLNDSVYVQVDGVTYKEDIDKPLNEIEKNELSQGYRYINHWLEDKYSINPLNVINPLYVYKPHLDLIKYRRLRDERFVVNITDVMESFPKDRAFMVLQGRNHNAGVSRLLKQNGFTEIHLKGLECGVDITDDDTGEILHRIPLYF